MRGSSILLPLLAGIGVAVLILGLGVWVFLGPGAVRVHVSGRDAPPLQLSLPSGLLEAGLLLLPREAYADAVDEAPVPWQPVLRAACDGLADCPDGVYVSVESGSDRVRVVKEGKRLRVEVQSDGEQVRVEVPVASLRRCGRILARNG